MILFLILHSIYLLSYLYKCIHFIVNIFFIIISVKVNLSVLMNNLIKKYMISMKICYYENNKQFVFYY